MKEWFSAQEILAIGSAALPADRRELDRHALAAGWRADPERARLVPGPGRDGGKWEYHLSLLPADLRAKLVAGQQAAAAPAARASELWRRFDRLPEAAKREARQKLDAVERVETLAGGMTRQAAVAIVATDLGVSPRNLWRWVSAAGEVPRSDRLAALAPQHRGRTSTVDCDPRAWSWIVTDYLRPEQPSWEAVYRRLQLAAADQGWAPIPSAKTLRRRLEREVPRGAQILARKGREAAARTYPHQTRDRGVFHAMQAVNADGHKFDVFCRWPDGSIARPVMVAIQDVYSAMFLAHRVERSENWSAVRHAFGDMIESFGIPEHCWLDNGRSFASKWLSGGTPTRYRFTIRDDEPTGLLTTLGVQIHWATPYHGQAKPIERAFRDLCEEIAKHPACAGAYTGNNPLAKPENYGAAAVPIEEFTALVAAEIARHNQRQGRRGATAAGRSFLDTFRQSYEAPGTLVRRATDAQRRMFLLSAEAVTVRGPTGEIQLEGNRYWAEQLVEHMGRKVTVRFDPSDLLAPLAVYTLDGRFVAEAEVIEATGFADVAAAKEHARRKRAWLRALRECLELERRMTIDEVARLLPQPAPVEPPTPGVVRLVAAGGRRRAQPIAVAADAAADHFSSAMAALEASDGVLPFRRERPPA